MSPSTGRTTRRILLVTLLACHTALLAWTGVRNAPNANEASHLTAGVFTWHLGRFDLYSVNPPLVRTIAAVPVVWRQPETDWSSYSDGITKASPESRPEWSAGVGFVRNNSDRAVWYFACARWACIPFSLLGGYFCWRWAGELHGQAAAATALVLWCVSPNVLAWSATICPDTAAAALGIVASYFFWKWLKEPDGANAMTAGVMLGLAQLTKMTWVVLFPLWPVIWLIWEMTRPRTSAAVRSRSQKLQLLSILALGVLVLNLGYGFEGSLSKLGDFTFVSRTLAAEESLTDGAQGGNRFADTWLADVPVPLPYHYLCGMDLQKYDFERGLPSYLCGQWEESGWWYYYLVSAALKVPLGTWLLGFLALAMSMFGLFSKTPKPSPGDDGREASGKENYSWRDEMVLLLPAVVLFVFVSSQTGFSRHFRYVLPVFPFLFIWISRVAPVAVRRPRTLGLLTVGFLSWSVASSLWIFPHSMSYFNELVGGPRNGHKYLLDSNLDWGQDTFYLKKWCASHAEARPLHTLLKNSFSDDLLNIGELEAPPIRSNRYRQLGSEAGIENIKFVPTPGWYAASVHRINGPEDKYQSFLRFEPVTTVGYSIYIYHITLEDTNRVRGEVGLAELPNDWHPTDVNSPPNEETCAFVASIAKSARLRENADRRVRMALFQQNRRGRNATTSLKLLLDSVSTGMCDYVSADEIRSGALGEYDVVVFPGGSGSAMAHSLQADGCQAVREFVNRGGGYVGICGGAFLATAKYDWSLGLVNARALSGTIDVPGQGEKSMAARGVGDVKISLTKLGRELFVEYGDVLDIRYSGGPVLFSAGVADLPPYAALAIYRTETWLHEQQRGTMVDTSAIVAAPFGAGRVILFSPHPELSEGLEGFVTTAVRAVAPAAETE